MPVTRQQTLKARQGESVRHEPYDPPHTHEEPDTPDPSSSSSRRGRRGQTRAANPKATKPTPSKPRRPTRKVASKTLKKGLPISDHAEALISHQHSRSSLAQMWWPDKTSLQEPVTPSDSDTTPKPGPSNPLTHPWVILQGISIAYSDRYWDAIRPPVHALWPEGHEVHFTHIVQLLPALRPSQIGTYLEEHTEVKTKPTGDSEEAEAEEVKCIHVLTLFVDFGVTETVAKEREVLLPPRLRSTSRNFTILNETQLFAARDFLCLASYHFGHAHPRAIWSDPQEPAEETETERVQVLLTTPLGCDAMAVDLVSILLCYESFAYDLPVRRVLKDIKGRMEKEGSWRNSQPWTGSVGRYGEEFIERIVQLDPWTIEEGGEEGRNLNKRKRDP